jgi:hypothetical protein
VIEPLVAVRHNLRTLYDFDLMLGGGHLTGYFSDDKLVEQHLLAALAHLADPATFAQKYGLEPGCPVMLFAVGDGNHSLATAKVIWEQLKNQAVGAIPCGRPAGAIPCGRPPSQQSAEAALIPPAAGMPQRGASRGARPAAQVSMNHPARYALVEIENIHDEGLAFEPILRVLFDVKEDLGQALSDFYPGRCRFVSCAGAQEMTALVDSQAEGEHAIGVVAPQSYRVAYIADPPANLPVGTLQNFLDAWSKRGGFVGIDYVHGEDVALHLGAQPGNLGFYLPAISKSGLFKTVIMDGALPRKTFSMGEAKEKRFYMEARRIA